MGHDVAVNDAALILELAQEEGFDLAGLAPLAPPPDAEHFEAWLDDGLHAGLGWLERNRERIVDPRCLDPRGRSLLIVGLGHSRAAVELAEGTRIARYAAGRDYHNVVQKKLRRLARRLRREGLALPGRTVVDAGPLLERSHAHVAGIGFPSKAANLLHPRFGPFFFLGEILLDVELEPTSSAVPAGSCGTCTACLDACPTDAILAPGRVDSGRCISYHTIENRGSIPAELRERMGGWIFGCDVCSEVCPWSRSAPDLAERFGLREPVSRSLDEGAVVLFFDGAARDAEARFEQTFEGSPLRRPGRAAFTRNVALALAQTPSERGRAVLLRALEGDPAALVREAAAWSLQRAHGQDAGVNDALQRAAAREPDGAAREAMVRRLD